MKKRTLAALIAAPVVIAGVWTAASASDNNATDAATYATTHPVVAPAPAPTVTVTTTVAVPTVPQSCLDALDAADNAITTAGEGFSILADAMRAASNFDVDGITNADARLKALNMEKLTPALDAYKTARDTCKAAG